MKLRYFTLFIFLCLLASALKAQPYGNEWIKPSQKYIKFRIVQDGIYKITYNDLMASGLNPLDFLTMKPGNIQLWNLGEEVPLYVYASNPNSWNTPDYFIFYGKKNTGATDSILYKNPAQQPHRLASLYTDTSVYYFTWNGANPGKRIANYTDTVFVGKTPEAYYFQTDRQIFGGYYWDGESIPGLDDLRFSDYTAGEGYMSWRYNKKQAFPYNFTMTQPYMAGPPVLTQIGVHGRSNASSSIGSSFKHHLQCSVKTNTQPWLKTVDTLFDAFGNPAPISSLGWNWIGTDTALSFQIYIPDSLKLLVDFMTYSYAWIRYPRQFDMLRNKTWLFQLEPSTTDRYVVIKSFGGNAPIIWDITRHTLLGFVAVGDVLRVNIPASAQALDLLVTDSSLLNTIPVKGERFSFTAIDTTTPYTFLIITHKKLAKSAEEYRKYRESTKQKTLVVYAEDLAEQFYYGLSHHPMSIRNFCRFMIEKGKVKPDYLLLLGKGVQLDKFKTIDNVTGKLAYYESDLVPTWGYPASDILLTAGLAGTQWEPAIATGRLSAKNDDQVNTYLSKLRIHENSSALITPWRKNILHLTGGRSVGETETYKSYLENLKQIAEADSFGGLVKRYAKYESLPVTSSQKELIHEDLRNGVAFTYYYGHGAASLLEVDIGEPDEANNSGKNPIMFFAGCIIGNCYSSTDETTLGERWIFGTKTNGAIAWIGNTWYGYTGDLYQYAHSMYENLFRKSYGQAIGKIQMAAIRDYQSQGGAMTEAHAKQIIIQGDPALKMYSPPYPDYAITKSTMSVFPENTIAAQDSFALKIALMNYGNTGGDSIRIHVIHTLPSKVVRKLDTFTFAAPKFSDTIYYWIHQKGIDTKGTNQFRVEINPPGRFRVREMSYLNDTATLYYFMPSNGADIVFPYQYAIVSKQNPDLVAQGLGNTQEEETFIFEIDTTPYFNSLWRKTDRIKATTLATCKSFSLLNQDTLDYYWRVKLDRDIDKGGVWQNASFSYIKNGRNGWAQVDFPQMTQSDYSQIFLDTLDRNMTFSSRTSTTFSMFSVGASYHPTPFWRQASRVFRRSGGALGPGIADGFGIVVVNPSDESLYNLIQHPYNDFIQQTINGKRVRTYYGIYKFNTKIDSVREDMRNFIDSIPDGFRVYVIKGDNPGFNRWTFADYQAIVSIGGRSGFLQNKVKETYPYILKGTKGQPARGREQTADETNFILSPDAQLLQEYDQVGPRFTDGAMVSERIGPAKGWETFYKKVTGADNPKEGYSYDIIPIDTQGLEFHSYPQYKYLYADTFDLRNIDAQRFPWLKVRFYFKDDSMRTMQHLNHWIINYQGVPEGSVAYGKPSNSWYKIPKDTLDEGEVTELATGFHNISNFTFDSILVKCEVINERGQTIIDSTHMVKGISPGDTVFVKYTIPSKYNFGTNTFTLSFNPNYHQPEQYLYNNVLTGKFYARPDRINPLLDVTFDGKHITDGSLVSSNTIIRFEATDENKNFPIDDTSRMEIFFAKPGGAMERISWLDPRLTFFPAGPGQTKARAEFSPGPLPDGNYVLQAQVMDVAGNKAGNVPYSIRFKVNNKPGMTRFYPYPNPFSTRCRFVFTLTGEQVPDQLRIRIMTSNGIVVKEIFQDELGPIRIGDNITDFTWDGKDQYGDLLANGVYFYTVTAKIQGKDVDLIADETDGEFFRKGIGKIVILR